MRRRARFAETIVEADEVGVPPLLPDRRIGNHHGFGFPVSEVRSLQFAPAALLHCRRKCARHHPQAVNVLVIEQVMVTQPARNEGDRETVAIRVLKWVLVRGPMNIPVQLARLGAPVWAVHRAGSAQEHRLVPGSPHISRVAGQAHSQFQSLIGRAEAPKHVPNLVLSVESGFIEPDETVAWPHVVPDVLIRGDVCQPDLRARGKGPGQEGAPTYLARIDLYRRSVFSTMSVICANCWRKMMARRLGLPHSRAASTSIVSVFSVLSANLRN